MSSTTLNLTLWTSTTLTLITRPEMNTGTFMRTCASSTRRWSYARLVVSRPGETTGLQPTRSPRRHDWQASAPRTAVCSGTCTPRWLTFAR